MSVRRSSRAVSALVAWALALLAAAAPSHALTKILVVPTARTMGPGRYAIDFDRKSPLLDASARNLDIQPKVAIGERVQLEAKFTFASGGNDGALFFGKYTFAFMDGRSTAAALGFENLGAGSVAVPYLAVSHLFRPVDLTVGVARGVESLAVYFTGIDYLTGNLHLLADYNTGKQTFASAGFQYDFSRQWSLKSGLEAQHDARADVLVKLAYNGAY